MFKTKLWMTVALAVAVAAPSWAQGRGQGRGFGGGMMGGPLQILMIPAVQEELKLTGEQKTKLQQVGQEIRETMGQALQGLRDLSPEERQKKMQEFQAETTKKINAVLNGDQQKRLRQLVLQRQGVAIIAQDEEVAKQLKITDDQKLKIRDITRAAREEITALRQSGGGGGGANPEMFAKIQEINKKTNEKIEALLTDDQKKQWKELCGAPFKFPEARRAA